MARNSYTQVQLVRKPTDREEEVHICWIPTQYAVIGEVLVIIPRRGYDEDWSDGWEVSKKYQTVENLDLYSAMKSFTKKLDPHR